MSVDEYAQLAHRAAVARREVTHATIEHHSYLARQIAQLLGTQDGSGKPHSRSSAERSVRESDLYIQQQVEIADAELSATELGIDARVELLRLQGRGE